MATQTPIKSSILMYTQALEKLEGDTVEAKIKLLDERLRSDKFANVDVAYIIHDGDERTNSSGKIILDKDGVPQMKSAHIHVGLRNIHNNPLDPIANAKKLGEAVDDNNNLINVDKNGQPQFVRPWTGTKKTKWSNLLSYLVHRTKNAQTLSKHQYDPSEVVARLTNAKGEPVAYVDVLNAIEQQIATTNKRKANEEATTEKIVNAQIRQAIDNIHDGNITLDEARNQLDPSSWAKLEDNYEKYMIANQKRQAEIWLLMADDTNLIQNNIWIHGATGVGKDTYARHLASLYTDDYYQVPIGAKFPFDNYNGEHTIIISELTPGSDSWATYDQLLLLLDKNNHRKIMGARYKNRPVMIENLIITSAFSPQLFHSKLKTADSHDSGHLIRRFNQIIEITATEIKTSKVVKKKPQAPTVLPNAYNIELLEDQFDAKYMTPEFDLLYNAWFDDKQFQQDEHRYYISRRQTNLTQLARTLANIKTSDLSRARVKDKKRKPDISKPHPKPSIHKKSNRFKAKIKVTKTIKRRQLVKSRLTTRLFDDNPLLRKNY